MRNKLLIVLLIVLLIISCAVSFYFSFTNKQLGQQIIRRDSLNHIKSTKDSIYIRKTKEYSNIITKYISNCEINIGSRKINIVQLVKILNETTNENQQLRDSLNYLKKLTSTYSQLTNANKELVDYYQKTTESNKKTNAQNSALIKRLDDSITIYRKIALMIKRDYGIVYRIKEGVTASGSQFLFTKNISAVDSALVLYPLLKDQITVDTINHRWVLSSELQKFLLKSKSLKRK